MKKIRIGNDFRFVWVIERNSQAEDLTLATNLVLTIKSMYGDSAIPFTLVDGNKVCVDIDSRNAGNVAKYNLRLTYTIPDDSLSDGFRDCAVDIDAFEIVAKTELAEKVDEFTSTSEIAIGFQGNSAFRVWQLQAGNEGKTYEDYIAFLREPMTQAIQEAEALATIWAQQEAAREAAEAARQENTSIAIENAELATQNAISATDSMLSNLISLEIRDDLCLWFETPETYSGITFELQNGNLTATI